MSGTIKTLGCDYNTEVVVGQVCATIGPLPFRLVADEDRAQVRTAEAQIGPRRRALRADRAGARHQAAGRSLGYARARARAQRLADTAQLFVAAGGGWCNRSDIAREPVPETTAAH